MGYNPECDKGKNSLDDYNTALRKIYTFDTIQKFWSCFNNLPNCKILPYNACFHIMRNDIEPKWECQENASGGIFCVRIDKKETERVWTELVLSAIGEQLTVLLQKDDMINGITLSGKSKDNVIQVWNKNSKAETEELKKRIKEIARVDNAAIFYKLCQTPKKNTS